MSRRAAPPRWAEALLERALGEGLWGQAALGDLSEGYQRMRDQRGKLPCDVWYGWQVLWASSPTGCSVWTDDPRRVGAEPLGPTFAGPFAWRYVGPS